MPCTEGQYIPIIMLKLKCESPELVDIGFTRVKPDLKCGNTYFEVECWDKAHYGLGQALAYKYGGKRSGLIVIVNDEDKYSEVMKFLKWIKDSFSIETMIMTCRENDCGIIVV